MTNIAMTTASPIPHAALPVCLLSILDAFSEPAVLLAPDYRIIAANQTYGRSYGDGLTLQQRFCYEVSHHYTLPCDQAGEK